MNLEDFDSVKFDLAKNHLIVGPDAKFGNITKPLSDAGKAIRKHLIFLVSHFSTRSLD